MRINRLYLLALLLGGAFFLFAQDSPIVISDGSLTIDATVKWSDFRTVDATTRAHPQGGRSVTEVLVTVGGVAQPPIPFSGQMCTVTIRYAATDVVVFTDNNGKGLQIKTDYGSFRPGASANLLTHINPNAKISRVTVKRGAQTLFTATPSGGTKISISYR